MPQTDEPGEIARWIFGEGLPGEFPFVNGAYPELYLEEPETRNSARRAEARRRRKPETEEPTRLFAGLGLAEDTNRRFHFLTRQQRSIRLSTAFDGPTLYGLDSDAEGVFGKVGEGGVAIDTLDDMERLYAGFPLGDELFRIDDHQRPRADSPRDVYRRGGKRAGSNVVKKLRGTVQADILKEVQAQNEIIFPLDASLRFLGDMVEFNGSCRGGIRFRSAAITLPRRAPHRCNRRPTRFPTASPTSNCFASAAST